MGCAACCGGDMGLKKSDVMLRGEQTIASDTSVGITLAPYPTDSSTATGCGTPHPQNSSGMILVTNSGLRIYYYCGSICDSAPEFYIGWEDVVSIGAVIEEDDDKVNKDNNNSAGAAAAASSSSNANNSNNSNTQSYHFAIQVLYNSRDHPIFESESTTPIPAQYKLIVTTSDRDSDLQDQMIEAHKKNRHRLRCFASTSEAQAAARHPGTAAHMLHPEEPTEEEKKKQEDDKKKNKHEYDDDAENAKLPVMKV